MGRITQSLPTERRVGGLMWGVQGCGMSVKCMYVHVGNTIESELADTGGSTATAKHGILYIARTHFLCRF